MFGRTLKVLLPLLLAACTGQPRGPAPHDRGVVSSEELVATHVTTLYQALQQIRPEYLHDRGFTSLQTPRAQVPMVYVDNVLMGDIGYLESVNVADVAEVRRISASEATTRFGTGHAGGAILVVTHAMRARQQGG